jgi:KTSC domain
MKDMHAVWISVRSSLLASIAYSIHSTLELEFRSGALYRYFAVPPAVAAALLAADSKGRYFNRYIRNQFRYQRLA